MSTGIASILKPEDRAQLTRLVLQSRYVVEGNLSGRHRSPIIGVGGEFADHRDYVPGDDPKFIDWKVLGRTDRYYIRRFENETNLRVYLVVDRSASMDYGSHALTKYQYATYLASALGFVTVRGRDSVGLYLYSEKIDAMTGTKNSVGHLNELVKTLQKHRPKNKTHTAKTLHMVAESIQRRALVVILSDLFDDEETVISGLAHFRKNNHDVILFHILDPMEIDFSFKKGGEFIDMETNEKIVVDPRGVADGYREAMNEFLTKYRKSCAEMKVDYRLVNTSEPPETFVRAYLNERRQMSK